MHEEMLNTDPSLLLRLQTSGDPAIYDYVTALRQQYGKYALPIEDVRRMVDEAMGEESLTALLFQMREEAP